MTTAKVVTTKVHEMHHVPIPTKSDTMACTESDSYVDTTCDWET